MRFEDVLPALRDGKAIQRTSQPVPWAYLMKSPNGAFHWYGYGKDPAHSFPMNLDHEALNAEDWVLVEVGAAMATKPAGTHFCGRRGEDDGSKPDHFSQMGGEERRSYCSYCGSASGDSFMAFVEAGGEVRPTDKNYKVYLQGNANLRAPGIKFYFQHLSAAQRTRFIELLNQRTVKIGFPGHFYVLPFFAVVEKEGKKPE
jgi:hypothetical protein